MGSSSSGKKWKGQKEKEEDINVYADAIPENSKELVQTMKDIVNFSEQEVYAMLLECNMDPHEAIDRLLSQDAIPKNSRELVQTMKDIVNCSEQEIYAMLVECNMDSHEAINRLLSQDAIPKNSRELVQTMKDIVNCSEQEIYAMLVECNMDSHEAINRLLSQDSFQEVKSKRDKKKEAKDTSYIQRLSGSNQNREFQNGGDYYVDQGGGNNFNLDETRNVQRIRNHLAGSSTTSGIVDPGTPLKSDVSNVETKRVPISSSEAVPSLAVPSSRLISALGCGTSGHRTMANVVKMGSASSKESVTKAPVKDDCLLPEKPVVPNPFSNSFIESAARRDQLRESASVSNRKFHYGGSQLCDNYNNKNDETYQVQRCSFEHNQTKDPSAPVNLDQCINELQHLRFGRFRSGINGSGEHSGLPSQFLNDDSELISAFADILRDGECHLEEEKQPRTNVANEQMAYQVNSNAARNYHSSPNCDHTEPTQENHYTSSSATDFTFDNSQLFNPVMAPSERSLQMQNFNTFPDAMHQQAYTRELNPWNSASPLNQSMPTASSLGRRLSVSMTEVNRQAMNHHLYSQPNVPSGHYGNMINYPYSLPTQNDTYDMPTSAFQQHGGSNNNAYHLRSVVAPLPPHRNSDLCQPTVVAVPFTRSSAYGSTNGSANDSAYGFGMLSDNTANLRFDYEDDFHSQFSNHLASVQHQNGNSNMWTPQGHNDSGRNYRSLFPGHQNQQSLGFRHNQQQVEQEEPYRGIGNAFERSRRYYASLDQQNNRRISKDTKTPQGHNDSGRNYCSLFPGHQNQQSLSFRHNQQEVEQEEPYRGIGNAFERSRRYYASLDQQNNRSDPSNQTQQQQWPRQNN